MLARAGWARWQIQFLARHSTAQIDVYVGEAWADQSSGWVTDAQITSGLTRSVEELHGMMTDVANDL